jgi:hypothetical protein
MLLLTVLFLCPSAANTVGHSSQSPTRNRCSHWRNSPLNPMLSATRNVEMRHRSICLPPLPGAFANYPVFPARLVKVWREPVSVTGLKQRQQLLERLLRLLELLDNCRAVHYHVISRYVQTVKLDLRSPFALRSSGTWVKQPSPGSPLVSQASPQLPTPVD